MKLFKIEEDDSNQRLDRFLMKLLPKATRGLIFKLIRKNNIKVCSNDTEWKFKKKSIEYVLKIGDEIKLFVTDQDFLELSKKEIKNDYKKVPLKNTDIIFEDEYLLIINKEPWINVHPWDYKTKEISLIDQVKDYLWKEHNTLTFSPSLIHRIDRETSGIIMIAKKKDILSKLVEDFKSHKKIQKTYIALVKWKLRNKNWTITKKLLRIKDAKNENKIQVSDKGQTAITHFKVLNEYILKTTSSEQFISRIEVNIETWRMHQIRVHMAYLWNPIIWDSRYWDKRLNSYLSRNLDFKRQALHASEIEFFHYWIKQNKKIRANFKNDMKLLINKMS